MKKLLTPLLVSLILIGCSTTGTGWFPTSTAGVIPNEAMSAPVASCSPMLSWLGGICTLCGMAMLMLTGGKLGWRPLIGGILFVIINYALAMYANWIFLPVVIATGAISLAWAGKIVWKIVNDDDIKIKEIL
jgi:hypothetical protein